MTFAEQLQNEFGLFRDFICMADVVDDEVKDKFTKEISDEASLIHNFITLQDLPTLVDDEDWQVLGVAGATVVNAVNAEPDGEKVVVNDSDGVIFYRKCKEVFSNVFLPLRKCGWLCPTDRY